MAAPLPLTDEETVEQQLVSMGFELNHIQEAIKQFKQYYGDDYNINTMVELTMQIKNKQTQIAEEMSNHNRQMIGNQLYFKIQSIEPILAAKITGMMLQWDTNKLINLLRDNKQLQILIDSAKIALENVPYKKHMELITAQNLREDDKIDFRNQFGKYVHSIVLKKNGRKLLIHFNGLSSLFDVWTDYTKQLHRLAMSGSISARPAHRLQHLSIGDMVDINPYLNGMIAPSSHIGWTYGKVINLDTNSGQVEVMYEYHGMCCTTWIHVDNYEEISVFRTKYEYVDISMDLLNWKVLETNILKQNDEKCANIKKFMLLNNSEIIGVSDDKIYKYSINLNKWCIWMEYSFKIICCCLNEKKTMLYLITNTRNIQYIIAMNLCTNRLKYTQYNIPFSVQAIDCIVMVEDILHLIVSIDKKAMHYIWNIETKDFQLLHTFDNLTSLRRFLYECNTPNSAFIHCKKRNILLLFGYVFGSTAYVYSLKQNKWFSSSLSNVVVNGIDKRMDHPLYDPFGFVLTNDEKYIMIFPGGLTQWIKSGKIILFDIVNMKFIISKTYNFLLRNVTNSIKYLPFYTKNDQLFHPVIINKTTILIDGFLKQCWKLNEFKTVRLLSNDVISMIKGWYGYDNDELYIYSVQNNYLWTTKVNEIIKHKLPKLKFCIDNKILYQEQQQLIMTKNQLLKQHNDLTKQNHQQFQQQLQYLPNLDSTQVVMIPNIPNTNNMFLFPQ